MSIKGDKELEVLLVDGAAMLGVELNALAVERFGTFLSELKLWNSKINLTAIKEERKVVIKHFLDSLTPLKTIRQRGVGSLLDIGAGGGFPGLPLKIAEPGLEVVLVDSVEKKVHFMRHVIRRMGLGTVEGETPVKAVAARIEAHVGLEFYKERFDCVTSRAFASLIDFVAAAHYFCRAGGLLLALKGPKYAEEIEELRLSGGMQGFKTPEVIDVPVPFSGRSTTLVLLEKRVSA